MESPHTATWDRAAALDRLPHETWDLVVVGGGVVGAGVARDAALRGLTVAIVDSCDWAAGTSSRTTKFAHGGLRYLELFDFGLVRTALAERATLFAIAPHLMRAAPFLLPIRGGAGRPAWEIRLGLALYDALAGRRRLGRHRMLDAGTARAREPLLSHGELRGAGVYWDARVRDARLVVETIGDARRLGAVAASYCAVRALERWSGGWVAEVEDLRGGERFTLRGRVWINATGPWSDRLRALAAPGCTALLEPTKGVHVVIPHARLPLRDATSLFASDGRLVFAVPEGGSTYLGTTDTRAGGDVDDLSVPEADMAYLLDAAQGAFAAPLTRADVVGAWAGWRPLVRAAEEDPSAIPRDETIEETAPGFLTVAGGKLTTYRAMAEEAVDRALGALGRPFTPSGTARRSLVSASIGGIAPPREAPPESVARVRELFGPAAADVFQRWRESAGTAEPIDDSFPYTTAEVERAAREMVETLGDLVDRRLSALPGGLPLDDATLQAVARVAAPVLGWSESRIEDEVARFRRLT